MFVYKLLRRNKSRLTILFFSALYLLLTLPALLTTHHILYNLEPYPDGLLYALSGRNAVLGRGLELSYQHVHVALWVPPLYSIALSIGYFFWHAPQMFYLTNTIIGVLTLGLLVFLSIKMTGKTLAGIVTGTIFLSHAYIIWLPTVPMSENIALLFLVMALYGLLLPTTKLNKAVSVTGIVGLFLTRYAVIGTVATLVVFNISQVLTKHSRKKILLYSGLSLVALAGIILILILMNARIISLIKDFWLALMLGTGFYRLSFVGNNLAVYVSMLLGQNTIFLWQRFAFTSIVVSLVGLFFLVLKLKTGSRREKWQALILICAFLSQFPLLLIFYTVDARYMILTIPILALSWGWLATFLSKKYSFPIVVILLGSVLVVQLLTQAAFFKQIVGNNWFHRSRAWQYEASQEFNRFFADKPNSYLITALPPFLLDAYSQSQYRILPLSTKQEFLDKQEYVWGSDLNYQNLIANDQDFLKAGKTLYVSNAYLSAVAGFSSDFEILQKDFNVEKVQTGCLDTCNIYKLSLK